MDRLDLAQSIVPAEYDTRRDEVRAITDVDAILGFGDDLKKLLSPMSAAFSEDSVIVLDALTGHPVCKGALTSNDAWVWLDPFMGYTMNQPFDENLQTLSGMQIYRDVDTNAVAVHGNDVFAASKDGVAVRMDATTCERKSTVKFASGTSFGGKAPHNFYGFCATPSGIVVSIVNHLPMYHESKRLATSDVPYVDVIESPGGDIERIVPSTATLNAWDSNTDTLFGAPLLRRGPVWVLI